MPLYRFESETDYCLRTGHKAGDITLFNERHEFAIDEWRLADRRLRAWQRNRSTMS